MQTVLLQTDLTWLGIQALITFVIVFGLSKFFTKRRTTSGPYRLRINLGLMDDDIYHILSDIHVIDLDEDIDRIVFSIYGIFVITHVNVEGPVTGSQDEKRWTSKKKWFTKSFDNPVTKNQALTKAMIDKLGLRNRNIYSIVTFSDEANLAGLDQQMLDNQHIVNDRELKDTIEQYKTPQLSKVKIRELIDIIEQKTKPAA